jgi:hypothetical protein
MAYDLEGCFVKDGSNGYQAHWTDPCGGADITACMELVSGVWQPSHLVTIGSIPCTPGSICCKKTDTGWVPILRYNDYSTLEQLASGCCNQCDACFTSTPQYIEVTVSGVTICNTTSCGGYTVNSTFTLEYMDTGPYDPCTWVLYPTGGNGINMVVALMSGKFAINMYCLIDGSGPSIFSIFLECNPCTLDDPPLTVDNPCTLDCQEEVYYATQCSSNDNICTNSKGGTITINWAP